MNTTTLSKNRAAVRCKRRKPMRKPSQNSSLSARLHTIADQLAVR